MLVVGVVASTLNEQFAPDHALLADESLHKTFQMYVPSDIVCVIVSALPLVAEVFVVLAAHEPDTLWYKMHESMFVSVGVQLKAIEFDVCHV